MSVRLLTSFSGWHIQHLMNVEYLLSPVSEALNYHTSNKIVPQLSHISFVVNLPVLVAPLIFASYFLERHFVQYISNCPLTLDDFSRVLHSFYS
jgi:hypothetical protein